MNYTSVIGPPGTGKTTCLIEQAKAALRDESDPGRIGFITYTRAAAEEGKQRIGARKMRWFGTVHSVAAKCLELGKPRILDPRHRELEVEMLERLGYSLRSERGARVSGLYSLVRHSMKDFDWLVEHVFRSQLPPCSADDLDAFGRHYVDLKRQFELIDFDDILEQFLAEGTGPELDLLLVDEAQDLTTLLWRTVEKLGQRAARVVLAGDNDQMLYRWTGADDGLFQQYFTGATVLEQSYRCARAIAAKAHGVIARAQNLPKTWRPTAEEGEIFWVSDISSVPLRDGKKWFVLAHMNRTVRGLARDLRERRVYFGTLIRGDYARGYSKEMTRFLRWWERRGRDDRLDEFALKCLQLEYLQDVPDTLAETLERLCRVSPVMTVEDCMYTRDLHYFGDDILATPPVTLMTINQAKGLECDRVCIDLRTVGAIREEWAHDYLPATRRAYVAVTRAREQVWFLDRDGKRLDCWEWKDEDATVSI